MVFPAPPMVELVEVAEGVPDGLEDRFPKIGVDIYTESIHKKFREASSLHLAPPARLPGPPAGLPGPPAGPPAGLWTGPLRSIFSKSNPSTLHLRVEAFP